MLLLTGLLWGCVVVPTGLFYDEEFEELQASVFSGGSPSREDVLFAFGLPLQTSRDDRLFLYRSSRTRAIVGGEGGSGDFVSNDWLLVEFDDNGEAQGNYTASGRSPCFPIGVCARFEGRQVVLLDDGQPSSVNEISR